MDYNPSFKIAIVPATGQVVCGFYFPIWSVILAYLQEVSNYPTEKLVILQESITCNGEKFQRIKMQDNNVCKLLE